MTQSPSARSLRYGLPGSTYRGDPMPGIAELALAGAPIAGGALLGIAAGNLRGPDVAALIKQGHGAAGEPPARADRTPRRTATRHRPARRRHDRARRQEPVDARGRRCPIEGNWRDIVVFMCAILFTIVWWNVPHSRSNWLLMFIVMIIAVGRGGRCTPAAGSRGRCGASASRRQVARSVVVGVRGCGHVIGVVAEL